MPSKSGVVTVVSEAEEWVDRAIKIEATLLTRFGNRPECCPMDASCLRCVIQAALVGAACQREQASGTAEAGAIQEFPGRGEQISMQAYRLDKISRCLA
jgi:hypothetical protein